MFDVCENEERRKRNPPTTYKDPQWKAEKIINWIKKEIVHKQLVKSLQNNSSSRNYTTFNTFNSHVKEEKQAN